LNKGTRVHRLIAALWHGSFEAVSSKSEHERRRLGGSSSGLLFAGLQRKELLAFALIPER